MAPGTQFRCQSDQASTTPAQITITSPKGGEVFQYGKSFTVSYNVNFNSNSLYLRLFNAASQLVYTSPKTMTASTNETWRNNGSIATGAFVGSQLPQGQYRIEICDDTQKGGACTWSGYFTINNSTIVPLSIPTTTYYPTPSPTPYYYSPTPSPTPYVIYQSYYTPTPSPTPYVYATPSPYYTPSPSPYYYSSSSPTPVVSATPRPSTTVYPSPSPSGSPRAAVDGNENTASVMDMIMKYFQALGR